jgi:hypothetical protein
LDGVRYKRNSALDQVSMKLGSKLNPKNFSVFSLLGWKDLGPEKINGKVPSLMEDVENVKNGKFRIPRNGPFSHRLHPEGYIAGVNGGGVTTQWDSGGWLGPW